MKNPQSSTCGLKCLRNYGAERHLSAPRPGSSTQRRKVALKSYTPAQRQFSIHTNKQ